MGAIRDIGDFRRNRSGTVAQTDLGDFAAFQRMAGRCPGCNARRSQLVAFHDNDTDGLPTLFTRTIPHYRCNGKRVLKQQAPLSVLKAELDEVGA
jgi:hypothetical protein